MCKKPAFQQYLMRRCGRLVTNEEEALKAVRLLTGIRSRTELRDNPDAAMNWQHLTAQFNQWNQQHDQANHHPASSL
ncbi:hypothetical protein Ahp2_82 [Aeromonas phage Ahp2]|nr:hypothetical protein Ahp2_82 [Aeromonas phage Ahp2]